MKPTVTITLEPEEHDRYVELWHHFRLREKQTIAKRAVLREIDRLEKRVAKENGSAGPAQRLGGGSNGASRDAGRAQPAKRAS